MNPNEIVEHVKSYAETLGGEFNLTPKGVPRIIMTGATEKISLVFVAKSNIWKAFYPYPSDDQQRKYFKSRAELISFLHEKGCLLK